MSEPAGAIRDYRPEDRARVEELYAEVFGERTLEPWRRRYEWQFRSCPGARLRPSESWIAEHGGRVVGFLAAFPMRLWLAGQEFAVLCPCDLMVSTQARGLGLGQRLIERYLAASPVLANAFQYSASAERIYDRLGYAIVDAEPQMLRPYDLGRLLDFRRRGRDGSAGASRTLLERVVAGAAAPAIAAWNRIRRPRASAHVVVECVRSAGPEFDELWNRLRPLFPAAVVRDREFAQWRFLDDPLARNALFSARSASGEALGYVATMTAERRGVVFGYLLDVFTAPGDVPVIDSLLAAALGWFEARDAAVVSCLGLHPGIRERVRRSLYLRPKSREHPARFRWYGDPALEPVAYTASNWHLSQADGDEAFSL